MHRKRSHAVTISALFALLISGGLIPALAQLDYVEGVIVVEPAAGVAARGAGGMGGGQGAVAGPAPVQFFCQAKIVRTSRS